MDTNVQKSNRVTNAAYKNKNTGDHSPPKKNASTQINPSVEQLKNALYFAQLACLGEPTAQRTLGLMYLKGEDGLTQNLAVALFWLLQAAEQKCPKAQYKVGEIYCSPSKHEDIKKAFQWTRAAALQGHLKAQTKLKLLRIFILNKLEENVDQSFLNALLKIEKGYQEHVGFPVNGHTKTRKELEKAAEQGAAEAQYQLGILELRGELDDQVNKRAFALLRKAAAQKHPAAQSILDRMVDRICQ